MQNIPSPINKEAILFNIEVVVNLFLVVRETTGKYQNGSKLTHPELYEKLKSYYGLDPLKWFENNDH